MKISISIPVYNRKEHLEVLAHSLKKVHGIQNHTIRIYDDGSTEFGVKDIRALFPDAHIYRNEINLGADINTYKICRHFCQTDDDILFLCDSDLIIHPDALIFAKDQIVRTEGVLSLLNSSTHPVYEPLNDVMVLKKSIGAAGTLFVKKIIQDIMSQIPEEEAHMWDWAFSQYLNENDIKIFVSKRSYVFHAGINGENSNVLLFDFAQNYVPETLFEEKVICKASKRFVEQYLCLSDEKKIQILLRKVLRNSSRTLFAKFFGEKNLIRLLVWRKKKL